VFIVEQLYDSLDKISIWIPQGVLTEEGKERKEYKMTRIFKKYRDPVNEKVNKAIETAKKALTAAEYQKQEHLVGACKTKLVILDVKTLQTLVEAIEWVRGYHKSEFHDITKNMLQTSMEL